MRNFELPGRSVVYASDAMAATSHPLATGIALDILKAGGNAMDASIAACAAQGVVEPQSTGIGGDCFCLYSPAGGNRVIGFNGSGKAPTGATADYFRSNGITTIERPSPHSVVVPGAVDAWCRLHADYGSLPLADILAPAVRLAREGYPLAPRVAREIQVQQAFLSHDKAISELFIPGGQLPVVGQILHQPQLADTLEQIGQHGRDAFYTGAIADSMVRQLNERGGLHTLADFQSVAGDYVTPISTQFRGHTVYECPPNGQGVIGLLLLNIMQGAPLHDDPLSLERIHYEIEACRLAYQVRTRYVADPAFADVPVESILTSAFADSLRNRIDPQRATVEPPEITLPKHNDTVCLSVVDKDRNVCSFINTLFWSFGSGILDPDTGVIFTNRAEGFSLDSESPNCIAPGKRPLHTIIPGMVATDDQISMSFGVMGGEYQAMGHMQFLTRYYDFGFDIQEAQDAPRFMVNPFNHDVELESVLYDRFAEDLRAMGHTVVRADNPIGGSQAVAIDLEHNSLSGGSDPRKDGCALGY